MDYLKREWKKLLSISLMLFFIIWPNFKLSFILIGAYLLIEHMWFYGRWDFYDILGHENLGIILLSIGLILIKNYVGLVGCLTVYIIFSNYEWKDSKTPVQYAISKIKSFWR